MGGVMPSLPPYLAAHYDDSIVPAHLHGPKFALPYHPHNTPHTILNAVEVGIMLSRFGASGPVAAGRFKLRLVSLTAMD